MVFVIKFQWQSPQVQGTAEPASGLDNRWSDLLFLATGCKIKVHLEQDFKNYCDSMGFC